MAEMLWLFVSLGVLGGCVRALMGLLKALNEGKVAHAGHFIISLAVGGIIGGILGSMFETDYRVAALAGYVGTDLLENLINVSVPQKVIVRKT